MVQLTETQLQEAQKAFDMCALNGILSLAAGLRGRDLLDDDQVKSLFDAVTKPLSDPAVAGNPAVEMMQSHLSECFAAMLTWKSSES